MSEIGAVIKMQHTLIRQGSKPGYDGSAHCMKFPEQEIRMPTPIETPEHLGDVVRHTRKALSLTQPQLALAAGVGANAHRVEPRRQPDTGSPEMSRVLEVWLLGQYVGQLAPKRLCSA